MKFKKFILVLVLFIFISSFSVNIFAVTENEYVENIESASFDKSVEIDFSLVADKFNSNLYVQKLQDFGVSIKASQGSNSVDLYYDSNKISFVLDPETNIITSQYPFTYRETSDILAAIFVDTISEMQGNDSGSQLPYYFTDAFVYSFLKTNGISKEYLEDDEGNGFIQCQIATNVKMDVPTEHSSIPQSSFIHDIDNLYSNNEYLVKNNSLILYKQYNDSGILELYIGENDELDEYAYDSVLTCLSLIAENKKLNTKQIIAYISQNYPSISNGSTEFDGVSIDTNVNELPINTVDTVLVGNNMKYAKFSIDLNKVKDNSSDIDVSVPTTNDSTPIPASEKIISAFFIILFAVVVIAIIADIFFRKFRK